VPRTARRALPNGYEEDESMNFDYSEKVQKLREELMEFMDEHVYPNEKTFDEQLNDAESRWMVPPIMEELKEKAKAAELWNLFLPDSDLGAGLTNLEYAPLCEIMGRSPIAPEVFNCSPPDTGNMEVLVRYGTCEQQEKWLYPLLNGEIRSCFAMTEPDVASSDATNIQSRIERRGDEYVINGHKWWQTGALDPRCKICIFMGKTDPEAQKHEQQSMVLVPMDTPGVRIERALPVFGYDDAPHGHAEMFFEDVRVPVENIIWDEGKGFAIAQGRLGPGRIHHCMRLIGVAERAIDLMCERVKEREAFGKPLAEQGVIMEWIADSRVEIEQSRLLTLNAAHKMDTVGNKEAKAEIAMIKIVAPNVTLRVLDRAIQTFGGAGVSDDFPLAGFWAASRTLRFADGPDEVHRVAVAKQELKKERKETSVTEEAKSG
jgi:acyl-CoA dehydrogenase